ncbi:antirestriction protein ArdA [Clostridium transplantifaecale]|uniref:antirestriction protein ArdA n=1 Tax=Clostridium transplantifaecale TaxID=2479838 RepID=UPI0013DDB93A|nr:antirestriction protein ArdA [Clostridium transplantifaecale]
MDDKNTSDYIFKAYVVNTTAYDDGNREDSGSWLYFPPYAEDIMALYEKIGLPMDATPDMYFMDDYVCRVEGLRPVLPMYGDIEELPALAQDLHDLPAFEREKLDAVQQTPLRLETLNQFRAYPDNVDYFCFMPGVTDDKALGGYYLHQSGMVDMPEEWKAGIGVEAFGRHIREQEHGCFSEKGYVVLSGDEWSIERFPKKPEKPEAKPSIRKRLEQGKKDCAAHDAEPKAAKHGQER